MLLSSSDLVTFILNVFNSTCPILIHVFLSTIAQDTGKREIFHSAA
jgi:hypothetical protein